MKRKTRRCNCWSCQLSPRLKEFEKSLEDDQFKTFREIFDEVWEHLESSSVDLGVLNSKIEGTWPDTEGNGKGKYYTRVGKNLYLIQATLIESQ